MLRFDINILWTIIDLLILYVLLRKFLFAPVHGILDKRKAEVDAQLQEAADTKAEAESIKSDYEASLQHVAEENAKSIAEAKAKATVEYDRIVEEADRKAEGIVTAAREKARLAALEEKERAENDIADMLKDVARQHAAKADDHELFDQFLKETEEA